MTPLPGLSKPQHMTTPRHITGLSQIASDYDALLCDAWGVIHNGVNVFPGVQEALTSFRQQHGPVVILTNAPRLNDVIPPQLDRLGLSRETYDSVVTSGDATRAAIESFSGRPAFRIGPDKDDTLFSALDIDFVDLEQAAFILCTGLFNDMTETPDDYREMLTKAKGLNLPMVCANPDIVVELGNRTIYCGGALAQLYEQLGGETILAGKPYAPIYDLARQRLTEAAGGTTPKRILAIGDGLQTDIQGANLQNIDVVFVTSGIFREAAKGEDGRFSIDRLTALLLKNNVHAIAALDELVW